MKQIGAVKTYDDIEVAHDQLVGHLRLLMPVVNNSIVGLSKVLHFSRPETLPIIDSRVLRGWELVFGTGKIAQSKISYTDLTASAELYLKYWKAMLIWKENINQEGDNISIRSLELGLYLAGTKNFVK